jgi:hypothetical protein
MKFRGQDQLWEAAKAIQDGAKARVKYESKRSGDVEQMEGDVEEVDASRGGLMIAIRRTDGQRVEVRYDGGCYSIGSHHPHNGDLWSIRVMNKGDMFGNLFMMEGNN